MEREEWRGDRDEKRMMLWREDEEGEEAEMEGGEKEGE